VTQINEANTSSDDDRSVETTLLRWTGDRCPEAGWWVPVGHGGSGGREFAVGAVFPSFNGSRVKWKGPEPRPRETPDEPTTQAARP